MQARRWFVERGIEVTFLPPVAREQRLQRLRTGEVDLALIDLASFVDTVATQPDFDARCVFVLTQRLPMAAFFVRDRPVDGRALESPADLAAAQYGGPTGSSLVAEHRALVRRFGRTARFVELPYERLFAALAAGDVAVVPDYAGIATRYQRSAAPGQQIDLLRYRDCAIRAYGIGFVASARGLAERSEEIAVFLDVASQAFGWMREAPHDVLQAAGPELPIDHDYALLEWRNEEVSTTFGYEARENGLGSSTPDLWAETVRWRQEVAGFDQSPSPSRLFQPIRG